MGDNNGSYAYSSTSSYGGQPSGGYGYGGASSGATLRRRNKVEENTSYASSAGAKKVLNSSTLKNLDFMFPKVDKEYTVQTDGGGVASLVAMIVIAILVLAEGITWIGQNRATNEHISVDTTLGARMRVNMNITFPGLACVDLHVDVMDVAGDSQLNIEDTLIKTKLARDGTEMGEMRAESNLHRTKQEARDKELSTELAENYCGDCYGAQETPGGCCNTCDGLIAAYQKKRWDVNPVIDEAEQCIREGRVSGKPRKMTRNQGCNLSGYMLLNRVAGNFHIAMGEGIERDGRHIHTFLPEDTANFNASHIIHQLSFGPPEGLNEDVVGDQTLNGATKIVTREYGTTGLFQYFIKVVPTTYKRKGKGPLTTNRYFFTERFRPLMKEYLEDEEDDVADDDDPRKSAVKAGHRGTHSNHDHHDIRNAVLPGVFFIYEIYPFSVEVSNNSVPFTHLFIRLMATVGGVVTMVKWADSLMYSRERRK